VLKGEREAREADGLAGVHGQPSALVSGGDSVVTMASLGRLRHRLSRNSPTDGR
jgi:hypothetical protein